MKRISIFGQYQGFGDFNVMEIVEVEGGVEFRDLINGDWETEFIVGVSLDRAVEYGIEIGLWVREDNKLVEIDFEKWTDYYNTFYYNNLQIG